MPLTVISAGIVFNVTNAFLNGSYIITNTPHYPATWLSDIRFMTGIVIFIAGMIINRHSDLILYRIRQSGPGDYAIPEGGLFRWVSCPNYLGEMLIWTGWMVSTWSPVAAAFALWTIANLAPRARSHHRWYQQHFEAYPADRHALIPRIW
jgi:steroid 5-alpha reductase family enzyme